MFLPFTFCLFIFFSFCPSQFLIFHLWSLLGPFKFIWSYKRGYDRWMVLIIGLLCKSTFVAINLQDCQHMDQEKDRQDHLKQSGEHCQLKFLSTKLSRLHLTDLLRQHLHPWQLSFTTFCTEFHKSLRFGSCFTTDQNISAWDNWVSPLFICGAHQACPAIVLHHCNPNVNTHDYRIFIFIALLCQLWLTVMWAQRKTWEGPLEIFWAGELYTD